MIRAAALLLTLLAAPAALGQADEVVGSFDGVEMRAGELRRLLAAQPAAVREQLAASPGALERLVRTELMRRALAVEARAKGWDKRPEALERMALAREQALVASWLDSQSRPPADYPSEKELRQAYEANRAQFALPRRYRVAQLKDGKAEELGWLAESELLPEIAKALAAMKPGETSAPIRAGEATHVVRLLEVREASQRPFDEARGELRSALRARRAQENERRHYDELLKKGRLAVNEVALGRLKDEIDKDR